MRRFPAHSVLVATLSLAVLGVPATATAQPRWHAGAGVMAPALPRATALGAYTYLEITGVKALSPRNAWAVGDYCASSCGTGNEVERMALFHWNGAAWSTATGPAQSAGISYALTGLAGDSSTDVWAVGYSWNSSTGQGLAPIILHWNGGAWSQVPSPNPGTYGNQLTGVTAVSAANAWAVGIHYTATAWNTLTLRWNGTAWKRITSPNPGTGATLTSVNAASGAGAWAAGYYPNGVKQATLTMRWNGTAWSRIATPSPGQEENQLSALTTLSAGNAWAAGDYCLGTACRGYPPEDTLILHWNGTAWKRVTSPNPAFGNRLNGISAASATDAWAVGEVYPQLSTKTRTLILHWNGTAWKRVTSPNPSTVTNLLTGVSADSSTDAWAVGIYCAAACNSGLPANGLLALHWNGSTWSAK